MGGFRNSIGTATPHKTHSCLANCPEPKENGLNLLFVFYRKKVIRDRMGYQFQSRGEWSPAPK
jgi:hypothetical protein